MPRRNAERLRRVRAVVNHLILHDALEHGYQSRIAEHFRLSRQRVHQIVTEARQSQAAARAASTAEIAPSRIADVSYRESVSYAASAVAEASDAIASSLSASIKEQDRGEGVRTAIVAQIGHVIS